MKINQKYEIENDCTYLINVMINVEVIMLEKFDMTSSVLKSKIILLELF